MHLAQIDKNNIVLNVIVADSEFCYDTNNSVKTYKNVEGKNYAGIGHIYHPDKDNFYGKQPFPSWTLDDQCRWQPPVIRPEGSCDWNEKTQSWDPFLTKLWVTNQNGPLQAGDSLVTSNVAGYFTKGAPAVVTIKDACDFSASTTETYYSNIASVTESNVVATSETPQEGYTENAYWTSNSVSYYTGNVVTHYSNVVVYDGVSVYSNSETAQEGYTAVSISQDSVEEVEGYTPVLSYSNVSSDRYDASVHTDYVKVVNHYSNVSVVETVAYSNITASTYEALDTVHVITPGYTSFLHEVSNTSILVGAYAQLTPTQRSEYTVQVIEPVTSNLQSFYTPQTRVVNHEIKDVGDHIAAHVECTFPTS